MMKKIGCVFLAVLMTALCFSSCKKESDAGAAFACAVEEEPRHFDPQIAETRGERMIALNLFDGLFKLSESGEPVKCAVSDYTVSADKTKYVFKIRNDLKYFISEKTRDFIEEKGGEISDSVTAYDFANGIIRAILPETNAPDYALLSAVKNADAVHSGSASSASLGISVPDDYTLEITLERATEDFLYALTQPVSFPCKKAFFELTAGRYGLEPGYLMTNGAFYLSSVNEGSSVRIAANRSYTGDFAPVSASVTFYCGASDSEDDRRLTEIAEKVDKGTYDCGFFGTQASKSALGRGVQKTELQNISHTLVFNMKRKNIQNTALRIGLISAVDLSATTESPATALVPPYYKIAGKPLDSSGVERIQYNVDGARESLVRAFGELGVANLTVELLCTREDEALAKGVVSNWQKNIGVELNGAVKALSAEEYEKALASGEYDVALCALSVDSDSAAELLSAFTTDSPMNITGYSSEEYDRLAGELMTSPTAADAVYCQSYLMKNAVVFPVTYGNTVFAVAKGVEGIYFSGSSANVYFYKGQK